MGVTEAEHPAVGGDQPVAVAAARRLDADHRDGQWALRLAPVGGRAEGEHGRAELVQARRVVQRGRVRGRARRRARRVELPRRDARDDAAHDRPDAGEVLVALAVTELGAAGVAFVARARCTVTVARDAAGRTQTAAAAPARAARRVAVDVVARAGVTERRVVGLPPAGRHRTARARVAAAVDGAAERGPARSARRVGPAQRRVRGAGTQEVAQRVHDQRGGEDRDPHEEAAARHRPHGAPRQSRDRAIAQAPAGHERGVGPQRVGDGH